MFHLPATFSLLGHYLIYRFQSTRPEVIKLFFMLNSAEHEFILLISVKIIVGILTFISMINTTSERLKARNSYLSVFQILRAVEISCSVESNSVSQTKPLYNDIFM